MIKVKVGQYWKSLGTTSIDLKNGVKKIYQPWVHSLPIKLINPIEATFSGGFHNSYENDENIIYSNAMYIKRASFNEEYVVANPQLWQLTGVPCIKCNKYCKQDCGNCE